MKKVSQALLGLSAFRLAPETVEEFNKAAGGNVVLDFADAEAYYRGIAPKVRSSFLSKIEAKFGLKPNIVSTKTVGEGEAAKEVNTYERDTIFIKRVRAEIDDDKLVPLLQAAFDEVGYDLTSSRSSGPLKKDVESAQFYIAAVADGRSTWDRVVANFESKVPGLEIVREDDGSVTEENMSIATRALRVKLESEQNTML